MRVFVLQGPSGSGKTTYVKELMTPDSLVVSADFFHYGSRLILDRSELSVLEDAEYQFDPRNLPAAHARCLKAFSQIMTNPRDQLFVDNTNISAAEAAPYMALAQAYGHEAVLLRVETKLSTCLARNHHHHGVPNHRIEADWYRMRRRNDQGYLESVLPYWRVEHIT